MTAGNDSGIFNLGGRPEDGATLNRRCVVDLEERVMDKDRVEGSAKQVKGAVKETIGKVVGDAKLQAEGKADKAEGKVQNAIGGLKDAVKK